MRLSNHVLLKHRLLLLPTVLLLALFVACARTPDSSPAADQDQDKPRDRLKLAAPGARPTGQVPAGVWWKDEIKVEAIGVNSEQLEQIEQVDTVFFKDLALLQREERRAYSRFIGALRANNPGGEQIKNTSNAFADCRARRQDLLLWRLKELRPILTLDQWSQLKSVAPSVMQVGLFKPVGSSEPVFISNQEPVDTEPPGE